MNCKDAVAALVESLESGTPMTDEQREHIRSCERCKSLLESAKEFQSLLAINGVIPPPTDSAIDASVEIVRKRRIRRAVLIAAAVLLLLGGGVVFLLVRAGEAPLLEAMAVVGAALMIGLIFVLPLIALLAAARQPGKHSLYKRLGRGRMISGVCLGIAQRFSLEVSLVRLVFFGLLFLHGAGFWLYLVLDLAMPVHPDDRQHLWRFRIRRWLAARRMAHAHDATR
jgi:phage shock protein PspC (stress-responsive transcriptional regulator)